MLKGSLLDIVTKSASALFCLYTG